MSLDNSVDSRYDVNMEDNNPEESPSVEEPTVEVQVEGVRWWEHHGPPMGIALLSSIYERGGSIKSLELTELAKTHHYGMTSIAAMYKSKQTLVTKRVVRVSGTGQTAIIHLYNWEKYKPAVLEWLQHEGVSVVDFPTEQHGAEIVPSPVVAQSFQQQDMSTEIAELESTVVALRKTIGIIADQLSTADWLEVLTKAGVGYGR